MSRYKVSASASGSPKDGILVDCSFRLPVIASAQLTTLAEASGAHRRDIIANLISEKYAQWASTKHVEDTK